MPRFLLHPRRLTIVLPVILFGALSLFAAPPAPQESAPASAQTFAALAHKLAAKLQEAGVKRVFVMDLEDPNHKVTPFGAWLADQFSSAPENPWAPIEIVEDRSSLAALAALSADPKTLGSTENKDAAIGRVLRATPVGGSYSGAENGIGVTLSGGGVQVAGKIAMTEEMKSHLTVPLGSLVPSDGVFEAGHAGISVPACEYCPNPQFSDEALKSHLQGTVLLSAVINIEGRATDITIVKALGGRLDESAVEALRSWRFKPAVNMDGKPVPVRTPIELTFRLYKND